MIQTKQVGVFPCRGWVAPCQRSIDSIHTCCFTVNADSNWTQTIKRTLLFRIEVCSSIGVADDATREGRNGSLQEKEGVGNLLLRAPYVVNTNF